MVGSLGYVTVTSAGTPVQATVNQATPSANLGVQSMQVQARPANAGIVYVGLKGMNKSSGVGVLALIPKPASATTGSFGAVGIAMPVLPAGFDASQIYIDADTSNDSVVISYTRG